MCGFIRGMGAGLAVGVCVGFGLAADKRRSKRMMHRAARSMSDMADRVADALGM